ncbi:hypothetical protein V6N13_064527 [Hibiscus sabdariffa]
MTVGQQDIWKRIWKLHVPQRVRVFGWLSFHERLLTNVERVRRHCAAMDLCEICMNGSENIDHVLRRQGFGGESFLMRYMRYSLIFRSPSVSTGDGSHGGCFIRRKQIGSRIEVPADVRGLVDGEKPPSGVERVGLPEDGAIPYDPGGGINIC